MKAECSKLLRSSQADHDYIFLVMQIVSKLVGTFLVKSSATTQAHSAVPELRFFTCQCTCAITHSWWWDGITNEVLVERLYRTSSGKFSSFHFAHSLYIHCPCQWHELLIRTFLDNNVFTPCNATPVQTVQQIRQFSTWVAFSILRVGPGLQCETQYGLHSTKA